METLTSRTLPLITKTALTPLLVVICGCSGAGKTTLVNFLLGLGFDLRSCTTTTTRGPRVGEKNGVHYNFITIDEFQAAIARGEFVEWAVVYENYYGTPAKTVTDALERGDRLILNIDVQGLMAVKALPALNRVLVSIFIDVPPETLRERLIASRPDMTVRELHKRLRFAHLEALTGRSEATYVIKNIVREDAERELTELVSRHLPTPLM